MKLLYDMDTRGFESTLQGWEKQQLPFATALALTRTAQKVKNAIRASMSVGFNAPTQFTLNATFVKPATKTNLGAEVSLKDYGSGGAPPSVWLAPEVYGGDRAAKRSEVLLRQKGVLPGGMFWTPGSGAQLDQYGNMSRSQVVQILSAVKAFGTAGFMANRSTRKGARFNKATAQIFVGKPAGGRLPLGIYQRTDTGLKPLMIFVAQPHYQVRLPFADISHQVYMTNFQSEFNQALRDALILSPSLGQAA
jgi:hypothetical protein